MRINPDCINSISDNLVNISGSWCWTDSLAYSPRYTETFNQPVSMEATTLDFMRFKDALTTITIRATPDPTSQVLWTGISYNIDDDGNTIDGVPIPPDHNTLSGLQGTGPEYVHLANAQYAGLTAGADTALHFHASDRARANHTGTQAQSTVDSATGWITTALDGKQAAGNFELSLGNPSTSGFILSSTTGGVRSWIAPYSHPATHPQSVVDSASGWITTALAGKQAAGSYQPLDADLTAIAALTTTAYGRGFLPLADAAAARTYIGAQAAGSYQPLDSDLTAIAALTTTAYGRGFLPLADAAAARTYIGAQAAGSYQPLDSDLTAISALTTTAYGRGFLTQADAVASRSYLGLTGWSIKTFTDGSTTDVAEGSNQYYTDARVDTRVALQKGAALGLCPLDSSAKVSIIYLPAAILGQVHYEGVWNASTNTPALPAASSNKGGYYITSVAGTYSSIEFNIGDWVISDGTNWSKVDNTDAISSWNGRTGAILPIVGDYASFYVSLTGSYANPTWITSLDPAKITQTASYRFVTDTEKATWNSKQAGSSVLTSIATLSTGTGLVKLTNGTASLDTSTYATTTQLGSYLPITNPTFTGTLTGPNATLSGLLKVSKWESNKSSIILNSPSDCWGGVIMSGSGATQSMTFAQVDGTGALVRLTDIYAGKGKFGTEAAIETYAGTGWSWTGHTGFNNSTTWSGFMQSVTGQIIVGTVTGQSVGLYVGQVSKVLASDNVVSISTSLAVNGAAMPAWGTGLNPIMLGGEAFLYSYKSVAGTQPTWGSNFYYDGTNLKTIATYTNSNYPRALLIDTAGTLIYSASNVSPTAGATITDLNSKFSVDRSGNGTFAGNLQVAGSATAGKGDFNSLTISGVSSVQGMNLRYYHDGSAQNTTYAGIYPSGVTWGPNTFSFLSQTNNLRTYLNASVSLELQITTGTTRNTVIQLYNNNAGYTGDTVKVPYMTISPSYADNVNYGAIYGSGSTPNNSNYILQYHKNGSNTGLNSTANVYLAIGGVAYLTANVQSSTSTLTADAYIVANQGLKLSGIFRVDTFAKTSATTAASGATVLSDGFNLLTLGSLVPAYALPTPTDGRIVRAAIINGYQVGGRIYGGTNGTTNIYDRTGTAVTSVVSSGGYTFCAYNGSWYIV